MHNGLAVLAAGTSSLYIAVSQAMNYQSVQLDPLNSPHPIPWNWVMATLDTLPLEGAPRREPSSAPKTHYFRTHSLLSPNGRYAAYSRIQMVADPQIFQSKVSSILFIEDLQTGNLQAITPTSPLANNPFVATEAGDLGSISIVIPVSWSASGDRLLAREFESLFCSDIASDYAVIVDCQNSRASTICPTRTHYTTAILLGWSQTHPDRALFRAGSMGENNWHLWSVAADGLTTQADEDEPLMFGQSVNSVWTGPQG